MIDADDDTGESFPVFRLIVSAKDAKPLKIKGPCSVWDMAARPVKLKCRKESTKPAAKRIESIDGILKCVRIEAGETLEAREKEAARRARQVIPKPPRKAKTVGRKITKIFE